MNVDHLDPVVSVVEEMAASEGAEYGVRAVVHHVVCADRRQTVPLQTNDNTGKCISRLKLVTEEANFASD